MDYKTRLDIAYWAVFGVIVVLLAVIGCVGLSGWLVRGRRFSGARRTREIRYLLIDAGRQARAFEDTCWYLLRDSDAKLARQLGGTREFVSDINEHRQPARTLVSDLQEAL